MGKSCYTFGGMKVILNELGNKRNHQLDLELVSDKAKQRTEARKGLRSKIGSMMQRTDATNQKVNFIDKIYNAEARGSDYVNDASRN